MTVAQALAIANFLNICRAYSWVTEDTSHTNRGEAVTEFLKITGLSAGQPWCAAYVAACGWWAMYKAWPLPLTASTIELLAFAEAHGIVVPAPQTGDIVVYVHPETGTAHHTNVVLDMLPANHILTIGGNETPLSGSDDGYRVLTKAYPIDPTTQRYIRWCNRL
jgi:hypothetical protein